MTQRTDATRFRHPADVARLIVGLTVLAVSSIGAAGGVVSGFERDTFRLLNRLPDAFDPLVRVVTQVGWIGAVGFVTAGALVTRRRGLALDVALAGSAAWLLAKVVKDVAHRGRPGVLLDEVVLRGVPATGHGFVSGHAAVAAALATVVGVHLSRPARRSLWVVVWLVAAARVYSGAHLPLDVVGGAALGWAAGAAVHVARGTPARVPSRESVARALATLGVPLDTVARLDVDARGSVPFVADTPDGPLFVKALGRDQRDADALFKLGRALALREVEDEAPFATAKHQIEHEAYLALLARRAGARVPEVVTTTSTADGTWLLVQRRVAAEPAREADISDDQLDDAWRQVSALRAARIAHRDLRLANVLFDCDTKAWIVDFGFAEAATSDEQLARDVAELLASSATVVGAARSVGSAVRVLGADALRDAGPLLQPLALSRATRHALDAQPGLLDGVADEVARVVGARAAPRNLVRVHLQPRVLVAVLAAGGLTYQVLVVSGGDRLGAVIGDLRWRWVALGALGAAATFVFAAISLVAAAQRPLALGRSVTVQLAASFAARATPPGLGSAGTSEAYLCANGLSGAAAADAVARTRAAGFAVHASALAVFAAITVAARTRTSGLPTRGTVLLITLGVAAIAAAVVWLRGRRFLLARSVVAQVRALPSTLRPTRHAGLLVVAQAGLTGALVVALLASSRAALADVPTAATIAVYLAVSAIGTLGPFAGGLGVVEPGLAAGLMAVGTDPARAVATVLVFRTLTFWLPVLPAALAFGHMRRRCYC